MGKKSLHLLLMPRLYQAILGYPYLVIRDTLSSWKSKEITLCINVSCYPVPYRGIKSVRTHSLALNIRTSTRYLISTNCNSATSALELVSQVELSPGFPLPITKKCYPIPFIIAVIHWTGEGNRQRATVFTRLYLGTIFHLNIRLNLVPTTIWAQSYAGHLFFRHSATIRYMLGKCSVVFADRCTVCFGEEVWIPQTCKLSQTVSVNKKKKNQSKTYHTESVLEWWEANTTQDLQRFLGFACTNGLLVGLLVGTSNKQQNKQRSLPRPFYGLSHFTSVLILQQSEMCL